MSVTIEEALQNAELNLENAKGEAGALKIFLENLAKKQLHNANVLIEKGYSLDTEVEPLLYAHGGEVENVPDRNEEIISPDTE